MNGIPLTLSDLAVEAIVKRMRKQDGAQGLRLFIKSTGCSGHSYAMELVGAGESTQGDDRIEKGEAVLFVPKIHAWMLFGTHIDYGTDDLGNEKFLFNNPNETARCGCGESFKT